MKPQHLTNEQFLKILKKDLIKVKTDYSKRLNLWLKESDSLVALGKIIPELEDSVKIYKQKTKK